MCRDGCDLPTTTQIVLGRMLHDLADALAGEVGGTADVVVIGPVDFGSEPSTVPDHLPDNDESRGHGSVR